MAAEEVAIGIDALDLLPDLEIRVLDVAVDQDRGIVDEDVEAAVFGLGRRDDGLPVVLVRDVVLEEQRAAAAVALADRGSGLAAGLGVDIGQHDLRAFARKQVRIGLADAAGCAGHDCHLACYASHVCSR